jgi:hypothetical protein
MTLDEALVDIERLGRIADSRTVSQGENTCADAQQAVRLLAEAYEHFLKRDALYRGRRRLGCLAPPPASVPPG